MAMSDVGDQIQLAAPFYASYVIIGPFVVIDDKARERLIKALGFLFYLLIFVPEDMYCRQ